MKYIDKDVVVAEIEKLKKSHDNWSCMGKCFHQEYENLLSFLDTLEVKEVDIEKETENWIENNQDTAGFFNYVEFAKHFFELGLKVEDWEKERMEECPYRQVGCTMYEGKILECRGACSWVVDYPKLKELKAQKGK